MPVILLTAIRAPDSITVLLPVFFPARRDLKL